MTNKCSTCGNELVAGEGETIFCPGCVMDALLKDDGKVPELIAGADISAKGNTVVDGHELLAELNRGGMGVVYKARQLSPLRDVALKMLLPGGDRIEEFRERFKLETKALAELNHPSILPLYAAGEHEGMPYFTMKLALGGSLADYLKNDNKLSHKHTAKLIAFMANAVFYAHQSGVLHRDIKPGNILFDEEQHPYLADFGLAKMVGGDSGNTLSLATMGTPCYMAPEIAVRGAKAATAASDIYGLGAVLYELLAGKAPFKVDGLAAVLKKVAEDAPEAPSSLTNGVPRDLEIICLTCLAKDPKKRYLTAQALEEDLQRWLCGEPITARRVGVPERLWSWAKRYPSLATTTAALATTLIGGGIYLWNQNQRLSQANLNLETALTDTQKARERADKRVDFMLGEFADDLEDVGRLNLLEKVWKDLEEAYASDASMSFGRDGLYRRAKFLKRWAAGHILQGDAESATIKLKAAHALLADTNPFTTGDEELQELKVETSVKLAEILANSGEYGESFQELEALSNALAAFQGPKKSNFLSRIAYRKADNYMRSDGESKLGDQAREAAEQAVLHAEAYQKTVAEKDREEACRLAANAYNSRARATVHGRDGKNEEESTKEDYARYAEQSLADHKRSLEVLKSITPKNALGVDDASVGMHFNICYLLRHMPGKEQEAEAMLQEVLPKILKLRQSDPLNLRYAHSLSLAYQEQARHAKRRGAAAELVQHLENAVSVSQELIQRAPRIRRWAIHAMNAAEELGAAYLDVNQPEKAKEAFSLCSESAWKYLIYQDTSAGEMQGFYDSLCEDATVLIQHHLPEMALELYAKNLGFVQQKATPDASPYWAWLAGGFHRRRAEIYKDQGQLKESLQENQASLKWRTDLLRARWNIKKTEGDAWNCFQKVTADQLKAGLISDALETAQESIRLWKEMGDLPGERAPWSYAVQSVCGKILSLPTDDPRLAELEPAARKLAAETLSALYGSRPPESKNDKISVEHLKTYSKPKLP